MWKTPVEAYVTSSPEKDITEGEAIPNREKGLLRTDKKSAGLLRRKEKRETFARLSGAPL